MFLREILVSSARKALTTLNMMPRLKIVIAAKLAKKKLLKRSLKKTQLVSVRSYLFIKCLFIFREQVFELPYILRRYRYPKVVLAAYIHR